ncbi:MAG: nicotinate mononucleotide-dependent phosphoribosyltransferase CobT [cyanobacterium endosymbiont of Rhopalodia musculus]|uniref:nicotinate mononucleotide-dependent phosphoribosyltransferase CobT n=1 Tax=cyanobacterium endosymbiont of Epithemia clementina EcSB TaxID=3034674 RepID=UPI0024809BCB|nr:TIGR00303 family protein [cyanobacterium endosymbiont of Epithemia clementina EcSB]WGT68012.1 TIGR00303 family protein [cyanobacterium endosymbiont of Epithemia clementina EcSB]
MIQVYTQQKKGNQWLESNQNYEPVFACILGFTSTGLIPGISAAGATPEDRKYTAIADAEFLFKGIQSHYQHPLPPLTKGVSPVFITRAILETLNIPIYLFNAGLPFPPSVPNFNLKGITANCVTTGKALPLTVINGLFQQGLRWGEKIARKYPNSYLILSECVVGGTTTALAILTGLGFNAIGKVNSSHSKCNHEQKWSIVRMGLTKAGLYPILQPINPFSLVAAVGDPMQIVAAGMAITASHRIGVLLAGGTQMLAVYALIKAIIKNFQNKANLDQIIVGTTRWVAEDSTGDTVGLAKMINEVPLLGTQLSFAKSFYPQLSVYEQGFVKEGAGAGGCAIAASLSYQWNQEKLLQAIESIVSAKKD